MKLLLYCIICSCSHRTNYYSKNTIYYSKTILHLNLITEVPGIDSALYFAVISDCVGNKILGDHPLIIAIAVLLNSAVKGISALMFYFLGYLDTVRATVVRRLVIVLCEVCYFYSTAVPPIKSKLL